MASNHRVMGQLLMLLPLLTVLLSVVPAKAESKCLCQASGCLCCVELNLTSSIDLGGPACVNIRQREQNVSLNLSYADNPVHNATIALVKAANKPTCMNLLSDLAQICAKFVSVKASTQDHNGYIGCLVIEPALLGVAQATYSVGCFTFHQGQIRQIENSFPVLEEEKKQESGQEHEDEEEYDQDLNADELIAAVSASAEQSIVLFSQWLGLNLTPRLNVTNENNNGIKTNKVERPLATKRNLNTARHGRVVKVLFENEEKSDERFKQLLSAQDNILKESANIDELNSDLATSFFYSKPEDFQKSNLESIASIAMISPENMAIVPSESRRGGKAYSIHQYANEV